MECKLLISTNFNHSDARYYSCQAVQNLGLAVFAIVAGRIVEKYGYTWLEVFFICSLGGLYMNKFK